MRTKEAEDREQQESTWIYLLHQQAPPASRSLPPAAALFPAAPQHLNRLSVFQRPPGPLADRRGPLEPNPLREPALYALKTQQTAVGFPHAADARPRLEHRPAAELAGAAAALERYAVHSADAAPADAPAALLELLPTKRRRADAEDDAGLQDEATPRGKRGCFPKKCDFPMCKNSSRSRGFCYSHGGGRRCSVDGCSNGAVSRDLCKRHGGGRRCKVQGCKSSSESGGLCYSHGGGRRCSLDGCSARAKKGGLCALHLADPSADRPAPAKPAPSTSSTSPTSSLEDVVTHTNAVETLLALARNKDEAQDAAKAVAPPSSGLAIASILN